MTILVENLTVQKKAKPILKDVNCRFEDGHLSTIIGVNGSGKSVFLKALLGFEKKDGQVTFEKDHKISYIPQKVTADQYFTVFEFILLGLYGDLDFRVNDDQLQAIESVMDELGIGDLADQQFADLSGGQQQLVVLAQALVRHPTVIIADEPTSALDIKKQLQYLQTLQRYVHRHQIVGIIVIHDLTLAARFSDSLYLMQGGQLISTGNPDQALQQERLEDLYGVELEMKETVDQHLAIIPLRPIEEGSR